MIRVLLALLLLATPVTAAELKLATWNVAWLTTREDGNRNLPRNLKSRSRDDLARLRGYADRLAADVIALQEVDGPEGAALILDPAEWRFFFPDERDVQRSAAASPSAATFPPGRTRILPRWT